MYLRNYKGKLVMLDEKKYTNERDLYIAIWKIKYNEDNTIDCHSRSIIIIISSIIR